MAKKTNTMSNSALLIHIPKRTTIGDGRIRMSSLNKSKRRSYKAYRGQGK
jgi:hypothetical protein